MRGVGLHIEAVGSVTRGAVRRNKTVSESAVTERLTGRAKLAPLGKIGIAAFLEMALGVRGAPVWTGRGTVRGKSGCH